MVPVELQNGNQSVMVRSGKFKSLWLLQSLHPIPMGRTATVLCVVLLISCGHGDVSEAPIARAPTARSAQTDDAEISRLIGVIDNSMSIIAGEWDAKMKERNEAIERIRAIGARAEQRVVERLFDVMGRPTERAFWLPIALGSHSVDLSPTIERLKSEELSRNELLNISNATRGRRDEWALRTALWLSSSSDDSTRLNSYIALQDWDKEEARAAISRGRRDHNPEIRRASLMAASKEVFAGSIEELSELVGGTEDPDPDVAAGAAETLRRIVDAKIAPPLPVTRADALVAEQERNYSQWVRRWPRWLKENRDRLSWSKSSRLFTIP